MVRCGGVGAILEFSLSACRVIPRTGSYRVALTLALRLRLLLRCNPRPSGGIGRRAALKMRYRKVCGFESHLGHSVSAGQRLFKPLTLLTVSTPLSMGLLTSGGHARICPVAILLAGYSFPFLLATFCLATPSLLSRVVAT